MDGVLEASRPSETVRDYVFRVGQVIYLFITALSILVTGGHVQAAKESNGGAVTVGLEVQLGHDHEIEYVVFSPDGRLALTSYSLGGGVVLWETASGHALRHISMGTIAPVFSPDSRFLLTSNLYGPARLWEVSTGREVLQFGEGGPSAVLSPDGRIVLTTTWGGPVLLGDIATGHELRRLMGHSGYVSTALFSRDGRSVLTASADKTARLWDATTGHELHRFEGHGDAVHSAIFSPDGRFILTASIDKTARLWDATTGRELHRFGDHSDRVYSPVFSPEGRFILTTSKNAAHLWDPTTGRELHRFEADNNTVHSGVFSPDGRLILIISKNAAHLWDPTTGRELRQLTGHSKPLHAAAFSADGRFILTGSHDKTARLWDPTTGHELRQFVGYGEFLHAAVFSPDSDSRFILTATGSTACLWDTKLGRELRRFTGHSGGVNSTVFSPDGRLVLTGSDDATARLWDVATGRELHQLTGHSKPVKSAVFSPDGHLVLTDSHDATSRVWDAITGRELHQLTVQTESEHSTEHSAVFSPDGQNILTASDKTVRLWDTATGRQLIQFTGINNSIRSAAFPLDGRNVLINSWNRTQLWDPVTGREIHELTGTRESMDSMVYSSDGRYVLTASDDGKNPAVRLWDATTWGEVRQFTGHKKPVKSVAFSKDGRFVLTASLDETASLWDTASGRQLRQLTLGQWVQSAELSPDGLFVLSVNQGTPRLWDLTTGRQVLHFSVWNKSGNAYVSSNVNSAVFSPDGRFVLTASQDAIARLWDATTGTELRQFRGHSKPVKSALFSPDGRLVLTDSDDSTARLWEAATGQELHQFTGQSELEHTAVFSPDGRSILTANDKTVRLWDAATGHGLIQFTGITDSVRSAVFAPDGRNILIAHTDSVHLWEVATGRQLHPLIGRGAGVHPRVLFSDGQFALTASDEPNDRAVHLWNLSTGRELRQFTGHNYGVSSAVFSSDHRFILAASSDKFTHIWNAETGAELVRLVSLKDSSWAVIGPNGRFDASDLEEVRGLHWVMSDDPLRALPLEIFMRDYYEPRLLSRSLVNEKFSPLPTIAELNRAQPKVKITDVHVEDAQTGEVALTVEVANDQLEVVHDGKPLIMQSGAYNLRVFREGQLVAQFPEPVDVATVGEQTRGQELAQWRQQNEIHLDPKTGKKAVTFHGIRLPRKAGLKELEFSAYAFNIDRMKSATARSRLDVPKTLTPRQGRVYVVTIGANRFAGNRMPSLSFAVNDAKVLNEELSRRLKAMHDPATGKLLFGEANVVPISLITDSIDDDRSKSRHTNHATKGRIKAVIDKLAGKPVDLAQLEGIANTDQLQLAQPEDLVLISFSTHGDTDGNKQFYLMPSDLGESSDENDLWRHAISSEELSAWLRPVDAGELVMIVDACRSAATVKNQEFKPGPMGSRGLGQLAFDKGMRILAASQLDQEAEEGLETELGLLTSALVVHGLQNHHADFKPPDGTIWLAEWLQYSVEQVPKLYTEFHSKDPHGVIPSATRMGTPLDKPKGNVESIQTPELFDYARGRDLPLMTGTP